MTTDSDSHLDDHLDRLVQSAYDALSSNIETAARSEPLPEPECPTSIGPYPVTGLLGRGGTSIVFRGSDPELGRELAIKVIDSRHSPTSDLAQRFLDEARLCSQLAHPGIVPIYSLGQLPDGRPYFTMKLVEGETLAALLAARAGPGERRDFFLEIFQRVAETVAFAHTRAVVHGDLKPHNVMVGAFGQVQVMDWGFSRLIAPPGPRRETGVVGTPAFMAPEQANRGAVDARTDVFGLGAILCVILTGEPPFLGGSRSEVQVRAALGCLDDALARLAVCGADDELVRLARTCLAIDPAHRPADAAEVASRTTAWFASVKERAHRLELAAAQAKVQAAERRRTRRRTIALLALACLSAVGWAWMRFEQQAKDYDARVTMVQGIERAQSLTDLGNAMLLQGDAEEALSALRRAHAANPADARALETLVALTRGSGAPHEAIEVGRAAAARSPESAGCWRVLGDALLDDGRIGEATAAFRRATAIEDNRANRDGLGRCLLEQWQLEEAGTCFVRAIEHDPTNAATFAHRGLVERLQGRFTEAIASFERSRELASVNWAENCRGWIAETERLIAGQRAIAVDSAPRAIATVRATIENAVAAQVSGRSLLAARLFDAVFQANPTAAEGGFLTWNRDWAMRAALDAANGRSRDAADLDAAARVQWRGHAVGWLRDAIAALSASFTHGVEAPAQVRRRLESWRTMRGFDGLLVEAPAAAADWEGALQKDLRSALADLEALLAAGEPPAAIEAPFDEVCTLTKLGPVPGVLMPYGGMVFDCSDADVLILGGHAQRATGGLYSVSLTRDGNGHVSGFRDRARRFARAPFVDGGLMYGPDDVLFYTRWPTSEVGQLRRGSREPDRVDTLPIPSAGGLGLAPAGFPGAGRVKILAWPGGEWFDADLETRDRITSIRAGAQTAKLGGGPDGFAWLPPLPPYFERHSILVAEWSRHAIATYELDSRGDPITISHRQVVSGMRGALGLAVDPRTGDVLISTWRDDGTEQLAVLAFRR